MRVDPVPFGRRGHLAFGRFHCLQVLFAKPASEPFERWLEGAKEPRTESFAGAGVMRELALDVTAHGLLVLVLADPMRESEAIMLADQR